MSAEELEAMRDARLALVKVRTAYPINGPEYKAAGEAMRAIDDLAELLTGRQDQLPRNPRFSVA